MRLTAAIVCLCALACVAATVSGPGRVMWVAPFTNGPAGNFKTYFHGQSVAGSSTIYAQMYDYRGWFQFTAETQLVPSIYPTADIKKWKHIAWRIGTNINDVWVNSTNVATGDGNVTWTQYGAMDNPGWWWGRSATAEYYWGAIDKACIVTNVLTPLQITNYYNSVKGQFFP